MKCNNCGFETEKDVNFCPNCGAKLNDDILIPKPENKEESQTLILTNPKLKILDAVVQFLFYFFLGMTIVTLAIGCKGFGLLKKEINSVAVWVSFAVSLVATIVCGIIYYVKFMREK